MYISDNKMIPEYKIGKVGNAFTNDYKIDHDKFLKLCAKYFNKQDKSILVEIGSKYTFNKFINYFHNLGITSISVTQFRKPYGLTTLCSIKFDDEDEMAMLMTMAYLVKDD